MVQKSGSCEREVKKRVQAGWNGSRKISGVICDRRLLSRGKRKSVQLSGKTSNGVWTCGGGGHKETSEIDGSRRNENVEVWHGSDKKRKD